MSRRLVIYDLPGEAPEGKEGDIMFSANPMVKPCIGCFGCWVKTPGKCIIDDRCTVIPSCIAECEEVMYISPIVYGGYSAVIKAVIDRSIPYVLPYFRIVNGEMHHKMRYKNQFKLTACFYGGCDEEEKQLAKKLVRANAMNFGAESANVRFYDTARQLKEAVL